MSLTIENSIDSVVTLEPLLAWVVKHCQNGHRQSRPRRLSVQLCLRISLSDLWKPWLILQNWIHKDLLRTSSYMTQRKSNLVDYPHAPMRGHELTVTNGIVFQNLRKSIQNFTKLNLQGSSRDFKLQVPKKLSTVEPPRASMCCHNLSMNRGLVL